ncbi:MAG: TadE/TadG family type IV pilus assembly protein [Pseudomonadota bacterium]
MMKCFLHRFRRDHRGSLLVETAFVMPLLVVMILAGVELTRYMLLQQKLDAVAVTVADLVAQRKEISAATVDRIFQATNHVITPFTFGANGAVVVTSVSANGGGPVVDWQRIGGGTFSVASAIGTPGSAATLPAGFLVRNGENAIVAEVFYNYSPLLRTDFLTNLQMYHRSFFRPRFGSLSMLQ